jgi:polyhydroxyalkanoate synthesis regulator phasin
MLFDDFRKTLEALLGNLTPANAQKLAKDMTEPGAAKEQVAKSAADLMEWSQHNRERLRSLIGNEIQRQMSLVGVAPQSEVDALKKRVRELERAAGMTASGRQKTAATRATAKKTTARRKTAARKTTAKKSTPRTTTPPDVTPPGAP